jgi:predicted ribosomally synthesized peptide with nif11-like leader
VSIQDAVEFLVRVSDDQDLFETIASLSGEAMVQRARDMGLTFTTAELTTVVSSPDLDPAYAGSELSDDELEQVSGGGTDVMMIVQQVVRQSYMDAAEDLRGYADKVKAINSQKRAIRSYLEGLR